MSSKMKDAEHLAAIRTAVTGLLFPSETDRPIVPFIGKKVDQVSKEAIISSFGIKKTEAIERVEFEDFFERLTAEKDWFGKREKERAERFRLLKRELQESLSSLEVFRVGRVKIAIFVAGITSDGRLAGVRTEAVET